MNAASKTGTVRQLGEPASLVIERLFEERGDRPRPSLLARVFGFSPLTDAERSWYLGALGELRMSRLLGRLPATWTVMHSVPIGSGTTDIDHVAIGPGGVFTINTKYHRDKSIWVAGAHVKVNGVSQPYIRKAEAEARRLHALLATNGIVVPSIQPVVAFVGVKKLTVREPPTSVKVIEDYRLNEWLRALPSVVTSSDVKAICALGIWPADSPDTGSALSFQQLDKLVRRAALRRRIWALVLGASIVAVSIYVLPVMLAKVLMPLFPQ